MDYKFVSLPAWPYPRKRPRNSAFKADWNNTLRKLDDELTAIDSTGCLFQVVLPQKDIRLDGELRGPVQLSAEPPKAALHNRWLRATACPHYIPKDQRSGDAPPPRSAATQDDDDDDQESEQ